MAGSVASRGGLNTLRFRGDHGPHRRDRHADVVQVRAALGIRRALLDERERALGFHEIGEDDLQDVVGAGFRDRLVFWGPWRGGVARARNRWIEGWSAEGAGW